MRKKIKEYLIYALIILFVVLIRTYIVTPVLVNGDSMYNTLEDGELMLLNKLKYKVDDVERFDIVVVLYKNENLIKRVIGLPGESIIYDNNNLYVNGKKIKEDFIDQKTQDFNIDELDYEVIPENSYFVMGDNRNNSLDSRVLGSFDKKDIVGNAKFVFFPVKSFGIVK
jgi:signal peptidase I